MDQNVVPMIPVKEQEDKHQSQSQDSEEMVTPVIEVQQVDTPKDGDQADVPLDDFAEMS